MKKSCKFWTIAAVLLLTSFTAQAQHPVIGGSVFGGGRMADVNGNTAVSVVNCDTISAVYGGNDIAGTVGGNDGSTVTLGTAATTTVNIGSVYGGGNGYYKYDGQVPSPSVTSSSFTTSCTEVGSDDVILASGTIPSIKKTAITVNDEDVRVDSLFGGAKNAFITLADDQSTSITINNGVIYSVFGGNNYGGTLANGSTQSISVTGTKIGSNSVNLGGTKALGCAWTSDNSENGIRYLFGGGNKVAGKNVVINITGGQIDTLFGGGNSADVTSTSVTVNVTSPLYDTYTESYSPTASIFDIRCLFGGNNAADMSGVPTLTLTKGGIHNVYGGGNKGEMLAAQSYTDNHNRESYVTDNATYNNAGAKRSTNVTVTSDYIVIDTLYGGGQSAGTWNDTYVEIAGGHIGVVYGGTNISGRIGKVTDGVVARERAKTNVWIHGGTIHNTVFGASNGYYRCISGSSYVNSATNILFPTPDPYPVSWFTWGLSTPEVYKSYVLITGGTVLGNVYSSGNMAAVGKIDALSSDPELGGIALLHITGGTVNNVFGGGNMGSVYGGNDLRIGGSAHITGDVYGGNDKTGRVFSVLRNTSGVTEIANASTAAGADITTTVYNSAALNISSGSSITLSDQNASTYTRIYGTPTIDGSVYGGGNGDYIYQSTYSDKASYIAANPSVDPDKVVVNGCSSVNADQRSSFVDINVADGGYVNRVFGGGNSMTSGRAARAVGAGYDNGNVMVYLNSASSPADNETNIHVGTIFGANNHVAMSRVPRVLLVKGKVGDVYGGGNMGDMTGNDEPIDGLAPSTYVQLNSDLVVVTHNIYGGCNVADVLGDSYVKIQKGIVRGDIFGGNDLAGEVEVSHVLIDGNDLANLHIRGNVYGGGNGDYPFYVQEVDGEGVYYTKSDHSKVYAKNDPAAGVGATSAMPGKYCYSHFTFFDMDGRPYVDSSNVLLNGKFLIDGNVYGGGISGDCRMTNVLVDAENGDFNGMIFGAGRGRVNNMGLRIGTCHDAYIGVAQDANNDGVTDRDGSGNIIYGTGRTMGNVLDTAFLTVLQFKSMGVNGGRSAMFGGGQSGNVRTTMVRYENTATSHLNALYLGCLASDVTGTATGIINANESNTSSAIIDTLYGGNDFTGRVEHTDMTVNSGVFYHMFGAGNGDYDYGTWITNRIGDAEHQGLLYENRTAVTTPGCADTVPYTMVVDIHVNGGVFLNTVYGGGNMGLVGNRDMVAGNMSESTPARVDDIGRITFNIHGGDFHRHVFTGARGKTDMTSKFFALTGNNASGQPLGKQLAYAQKILNMDSGHVAFSVYGGSEAVDDGYPYECRDKVPGTSTTLRPSSVLNITGGHIEKSVYGGGYQGNIYGSVYVNIGIDAVRDSKVWDYTNGSGEYVYNMADYKPNLVDHSGYDMTNTYNSSTHKVDKVYVPVSTSNIPGNPTLKKNVVDLSASVYNASDWGEAGSNAYFSTRGVFGGVTNILIDGKGYYTSLTNPFTVDLPSMSIANSIIGAGTSTEGGDVNRLITMRHFGDYSCPEPSKTLFSIQRADKVVLDSVFLVLQGEQDAFSAYASPSYSLCRIDTLIFRVDNIVMVEAPAIYLGYVVSMKTDEVYAINDPNQIYDTVTMEQPTVDDVVSTVPNDFFDNLLPANHADCNNPTNPCQDLDICAKLPTQRGSNESVAASNVLMMRNGSYVKISPFIDGNGDGVDDIGHQFGHVYGWMFLLAQDATLSYVYADTKTNSNNMTDGGFIAPCWCDNFSGDANNEIDYVNVNVAGDDDYRSWKVGTNLGTRVRNITLVANATPDNRLNFNLPAANYVVYVGSNNVVSDTSQVVVPADAGYAYATTYLELPPADGGNFYIINSVLIDQDNGGQLTLIDQGYLADSNRFAQTTNGITLNLSNIAADPDYTFGLTFSSGNNFNNSGSCWNDGAIGSVTAPGSTRNLTENGQDGGTPYPCWYRSLISGNTHITNQGGYLSNAIISGAVGAIPTMNFTLTYNTNIHSTITRDVLFTMLEFDSQGNFVGPVEVTVTISTVIKEFDDLEAPVLAMFNEGITNDYVRKVTIPASFQQRDIYIEGIEWIKDTVGNYSPSETSVFEHSGKKKWFQMAEYTGTPVESNNIFSVIVTPTESTTENINNSLGWYHIAKPDGFDVYKVTKEAYEHKYGSGTFSTDANNHKRDSNFCSWDLNYDHVTDASTLPMDPTEERGLWVGTLDGRSTASIDVTLKFNGMYYYRDQFNPPLAWVRLKCHYYNTKSDDHDVFYINVKLRTRLEGDTIYMAPDKTLTRIAKAPNGDTKTITMHAYGYGYDESRNDGAGGYEDGTQNPPDVPPNYTNLAIHRNNIKNNPNNYLQDFRQVMLIFDEGDVIDIMETIPITSGTEPISVMGDDYSTIQVIRYSGSHFKFPTLGCANRNPLIEVYGSGFLTMRNVWFNGSGCTRAKEGVTVTEATGGECNTIGSYKYYQNHARVKELLYANAPIIYCHGNGNVAFTKRVIMSNNFNSSWTSDTNDVINNGFIGGGAVAVARESGETGNKPTVTLGDLCNLYDNVVVDWDAVVASQPGGLAHTSDWLPRNYGGGVYVDNGQLVFGSGSKGAELHVERNYYIKNLSNNAGIRTKTAKVFADGTGESDEMIPKSFQVYYLDTLEYPAYFALSNVYLTRKAASNGGCSNLVRLDEQSDVVYFLSEMTNTSKIGISKWFPGYVYDNTRSGIHLLENEAPRDTIAIARIGKGKSNTSMVDNNYSAKIFFNDSSYYAIANRPNADPLNPTVVHPAATPSFTGAYPAVAYTQNDVDYPAYNDKIFIFRHTSLDQYNIYFQRCASFGKGIHQELDESACFANLGRQFNLYAKGDSVSYHWNPTATCAMATDTLRFHVGGGFFPYTYKWEDVTDPLSPQQLHSRRTVGSNAISLIGNPSYDALRVKAEYDTLVMRLEVASSALHPEYVYKVTASDLTGNCAVTQDVKVKIAKIVDESALRATKKYVDADNFLLHRQRGTAGTESDEPFFWMPYPGVDSSSFHDRVDHVYGETKELRAGWKHATGDEQLALHGKPYKGDGSTDVGDMTPRYLRLFVSFKVKPSIYPPLARGSVDVLSADGSSTIYTVSEANMADPEYSPSIELCPGEILQLRPTAASSSPAWEFMAWNYDPTSPSTATFVVSDSSRINNPVAYYSPGDYWWQAVTSFDISNHSPSDNPSLATRYDYDLDYYGNVRIRTNKGLAWLISTVNGYNNQNAQTFHFDTIFLDFDANMVDMSAHKWSPLGTKNNPFEGVFVGTDDNQHIANIIVNEDTVPLVGLFGYTNGAELNQFILDSAIMKGKNYVGSIVAQAENNTLMKDVTIERSVLFGQYFMGGMAASMKKSVMDNCKIYKYAEDNGVPFNDGLVRMFGEAIYAGGLVGYATGDTIRNCNANTNDFIERTHLSPIYYGGLVGYNKAENVINKKGRRKVTTGKTVLNNNYVHIATGITYQRVGGLIGYAEDVDMNNNYVYGIADYDKINGLLGGLAGFVGENVTISNCYFVDGMANDIIGYNNWDCEPRKSTTFHGRGNRVLLTEHVDGYSNMTRALNAWVRTNNSGNELYKTWRSDLDGINSGYPIFGEPDMIPVNDTLQTTACNSYEFDGITFDQSGTYIFHMVDSADYLDSTFTLILTISNGDTTTLFDTVVYGNSYVGNGFTIGADELTGINFDQRHDGVYMVRFVDSLYNSIGCDSTVILTLYVVYNGVNIPDVVQTLTDVKVYPNPTRGVVNVEGTGLQSIEVYDNISRRVLSRNVEGDKAVFDLSNQAAGTYYIRVRTANGTVVKKLIKK